MLENYEVQFDLIFQVPQLKENFYSYLKATLNEDAFDFCAEVQEYKKILTNHDTQTRKASKIIDNYVRAGSSHEINIGNKVRNEVLHDYLKVNVEDKDKLPYSTTLFDPVYANVYRELKQDSFARYLRSEEFAKFINKMGEPFLKNISIDLRVAGSRNAILYQPSDFSSTHIDDRDITFITKLNEDSSDYTKISNEKDFDVYLSRTHYTIGAAKNSKGFKISRTTGTLPFNAEFLLELYMSDSGRREIDSNMKSMDHIQYMKNDEYNFPYSISLVRITYQFAMHTKRNGHWMFTVISDFERQSYTVIGKTTDAYDHLFPDDKPDSNIDSLTGYTFIRVSDNLTRFVNIVYGNTKTPVLEDTIFNRTQIARGRAFFDNITKLAKEKGEYWVNPERETNEGTRRWETLADFHAKYQNKTWSL
jgi:hypothetical protein